MEQFLKDAGDFLGSLAYMIGAGLYYIYAVISEAMGEMIKNIKLPMMPSRSKILNQTYVSGSLLLLFLIYVVFINIKTYKMFVHDKKSAERKMMRISEARLLRHCFFGGAAGGLIGMKQARHKTRKPTFAVWVTVMLVIQILIFSFVAGFFGFWIYLS